VGRGEALNRLQISRLSGRYFKLKDSFNLSVRVFNSGEVKAKHNSKLLFYAEHFNGIGVGQQYRLDKTSQKTHLIIAS